jgi:hypothetical protein
VDGEIEMKMEENKLYVLVLCPRHNNFFFFEICEQFVTALAVGNFVGSFWRSQPSVMLWFVTDMSVNKLLTDLPSNFIIFLIL